MAQTVTLWGMVSKDGVSNPRITAVQEFRLQERIREDIRLRLHRRFSILLPLSGVQPIMRNSMKTPGITLFFLTLLLAVP